MTSSPCSESRLPVGSSARIRFGWLTTRARHRDALLLSARELPGQVVAAVADVHAFEHGVDFRAALAPPASSRTPAAARRSRRP